MRSALAVLAGAALWAALWLASNAALAAALPDLFREDGSTGSALLLFALLDLSVVFSLAAGWAAGAVAREREVGHALALGILQLVLGAVAEAASWDVLPVWYHVTFLALLVPVTVLGGALRRRARLRVRTA